MKSSKRAVHLALALIGAGLVMSASTVAIAYDGTKCKEPGICWEPKPGYPAKIAGSKYDPKHNPTELAKQQESITAMEERNRKRVEHFKKTGQWVYDVSKIPAPAT
jgi:methanol dehydrogenase (cytochrome c) subunit 2